MNQKAPHSEGLGAGQVLFGDDPGIQAGRLERKNARLNPIEPAIWIETTAPVNAGRNLNVKVFHLDLFLPASARPGALGRLVRRLTPISVYAPCPVA